METYFNQFREHIIGVNHEFVTPKNEKKQIVYADWTASGRLYKPIEDILTREIYPYVANTHTDTNFTGSTMTYAYHKAQQIIKKHVGANFDDIIISSNSGMTGVVNKLQRILGLKIHESHAKKISWPQEDKPVVFITHMEHHSNQTSWFETIADVVVVAPNSEGLVCLNTFEQEVKKYHDRPLKIAAVTSCSNVTGIFTPYHKIAEIMHKNNGYCFVDFACSAPYVNINMHPVNELERLDAIYFSPHKFLGGPGTSGILIFNKNLYKNQVPDNPGGGTVEWTNPWGEHKYVDDIEAREDGGTPAFLQTIKVALCVQLKEKMGVDNILKREKEQLEKIWSGLNNINNLHILAHNIKDRLCIFSFYIDDLHYNIGVKILNDRFGIQVRGGCSCAGTYGHYLLNVDHNLSKKITSLIDLGDYSEKPGWIRLSIHPTTTNEEIDYIIQSIKLLAKNHVDWSKEYMFDKKSNSITCKQHENYAEKLVNTWFSSDLI